MRNEYRFEMKGKCPADDRGDVYSVVVRASRVITVEEILEAASRLSLKPAYQEDMTLALHRELQAEVETRGWHSGVLVVCVCGGPF